MTIMYQFALTALRASTAAAGNHASLASSPSRRCLAQGSRRASAGSYRQAGFSLLELCVGLAVLGILIALAIPAMSAWMRNAQLRKTADSIQNGLQLARSEAVRRNAFVTYTQEGMGWKVTTPSETDPIQTDPTDAAGTTVVSASKSTVVFSGLGWVTPTADATFNVSNPDAGACADSGGPIRCLRVSVSAMGEIRMCDPAAQTGTAAACS